MEQDSCMKQREAQPSKGKTCGGAANESDEQFEIDRGRGSELVSIKSQAGRVPGRSPRMIALCWLPSPGRHLRRAE